MNVKIGLRSSCIPPVNTVRHGGQRAKACGTTDHSCGSWSLEFSAKSSVVPHKLCLYSRGGFFLLLFFFFYTTRILLKDLSNRSVPALSPPLEEEITRFFSFLFYSIFKAQISSRGPRVCMYVCASVFQGITVGGDVCFNIFREHRPARKQDISLL